MNNININESFGSIQNNFRYRFTNFISGDQFTIVEDMPAHKPIRFETEERTKDGRKFESKTYLIRITSRGYEADLAIYAKDLPRLAVLCPKGLSNFKGASFVFDGTNWSYLGIDTNISAPTQNAPMTQNTPGHAQNNVNVYDKMMTDMKYLNSVGTEVTPAVLTKICDSIHPGKAIDMIQQAKAQGYIYEQGGVFKVA